MNSVFSVSNPAFDYMTQNPPIITNGLVCYYSFENPNCYIGMGTTIKDLTNSGNTGTWGSSTAYTYNPRWGSFSFTNANNQFLNCTNNGLQSFSSMTIGYWVYANGSGGIVACGNAGARNFQSVVDVGNKRLEWYSIATGEWFSTTNGVTSATGWHYWTTAIGGGVINWYQDGLLINQSTSVPALGSTSGTTLTIGYDFYATYFNGLINTVQIYNRILSAAEVSYNYTAGRWRFL